jgi:PAS domain S-box-containing protein
MGEPEAGQDCNTSGGAGAGLVPISSPEEAQEQLLWRIQQLEARLEESESTLQAIRCGEVDALVVTGAAGPQVYTLHGADHLYRLLVQEMQEGALTLTPAGSILYVNLAFARMIRTPLEHVIGTSIQRFVAPQDLQNFMALFEQGGCDNSRGEVTLQTADGTLVPVSFSCNSLQIDDAQHICLIVTDLSAQKQQEAELSRTNATLQAEIVQHKQAREELERQQAALAQREKLAAMGALLANVAHELNNPLSVVMMHADLLREEAGTTPLAQHAAELTQATERCIEIVHNFLGLARQQPPMRTRVVLNTVVETAMKLLVYPLRVDSITVEQYLAPNLPVLWADPHQLQQVVVNLVTNAHQALRETTGPRQLTITTRAEPEQARVILEVADTGPGIPSAVQARIFEPFFTTKQLGVGTGLGLPLCRGIVEGHGGTLHVESTLGRGAVFRVELPLVPIPAETLVPESVTQPVTKGLTILIVDDEQSLARALAYLLRRDGHTVQTVANGRLALETCQGQDYALILCDLRMPELDGPGFYQELEHHYPHLCPRVVFLTGDTLNPEAEAFIDQTGALRLSKPFTVAMVRQVIRRVCIPA